MVDDWDTFILPDSHDQNGGIELPQSPDGEQEFLEK